MGIVFVAVLGSTILLFNKVPKGFIPETDMDQLSVNVEALQGTSYYQMVEYQKAIAEVFRTHKDVAALMSTVGGTSASTLGGPNYGEIVVHLDHGEAVRHQTQAEGVGESL